MRITHTVVLDDPFDDPSGLAIPPGSPVPDPAMLKTDRLAADEDVEDDGGATAEELTERMAAKEAWQVEYISSAEPKYLKHCNV